MTVHGGNGDNLNTLLPEDQKCDAIKSGLERECPNAVEPIPTQPSNQRRYDSSKLFSW